MQGSGISAQASDGGPWRPKEPDRSDFYGASTGTKNPRYLKTLYVDELIGPDTVNTVPTDTYHAFRREGRARPALTENWNENIEKAYWTMEALEQFGISMSEVTARLLDDGVKKFADAFDMLLDTVESKRRTILEGTSAKKIASEGGGGNGSRLYVLDSGLPAQVKSDRLGEGEPQERRNNN